MDWVAVGFSTTFLLTCSIYLLLRSKKRRKCTQNVIIFSRYPTPGATKTRLFPALGPRGAAEAQLYMTEHMLDKVQDFGEQDLNTRMSVYYIGATPNEIRYWLQRRDKLSCVDLTWAQQTGDCLTEKLANAFRESFSSGHEYVLVIGSDIPGIDADILTEAFESLHRTSTDAVIGKSEDGGYYLIGLTLNCKNLIDRLFEGIDWGSHRVFQQQAISCQRFSIRVHVLSRILKDVDVPDDLCEFEDKLGIPISQLKQPTWSVIIPALNEEDYIYNTLDNVVQNCHCITNLEEIIVIDGGSSDDTVKTVKTFAEYSPVPVNIVCSKPGRGFQLRAGAAEAKGTYLIFIQADTKVPQNFETLAHDCLQVPGTVCGAFQFDLDILQPDNCDRRKKSSWWFIQQLKFIRLMANLRSVHLERPYGDQSLFMRKKTYDAVGGFKEVYLMEDFMLVLKLQKIGHIATVFPSCITSARRWEAFGAAKVTLINQLTIAAYSLGVHPNTLARWYYGKKLKT